MSRRKEVSKEPGAVRRLYHRMLDRSRFGTQVVITMGTNLALMLLSLATGVLSARLLGPVGRGQLAAIQTWPIAIALIALLGMPEALVYFSGRYSKQSGQYLTSAICITLLACLPFAAIAYWLMPVLLSSQASWVVAAARWYLLIIPIYAVMGLPYQPLRGRGDLTAWNSLRLVPAVGWLTVLIVALFSNIRSPSLLAAAGLFATLFCAFPISYVALRRIPGPFRPDPAKWGPLLRYGLPCMVTTMPQLFNLRLDQMLMVSLLPPRYLGLYVVAVAWGSGLNPLLSALGLVLFPKVASISEVAPQQEALAQGSRLGVILAIFLTVPMMAITPFFVPLLFGRGFRAAIPSALVLVVASGVLGFDSILEEGLRGLGKPKAVMWAEFAGLASTALLLALLLRPFKIMGAAIASLVAYLVVACCLLAQATHFTDMPLRHFLWPSSHELRMIWKKLALKEGLRR